MEQNRMEWNWKCLLHNMDVDTGYAMEIGVNMSGLSMYGELISCPVPTMKAG